MSASKILLNAVAFQIAWFAALYGGILDLALLAVLPALAAATWHVVLMRHQARSELKLFAAVLVLGLVVETAFVTLGTITYIGSPLYVFGPPLWILAMWLAFATLPNGCLNWLHGKRLLQVVLGGLTGPLSYLAGGKLGGATLHEPILASLAIIGIGWALALPAIFWVADYLRGEENRA